MNLIQTLAGLVVGTCSSLYVTPCGTATFLKIKIFIVLALIKTKVHKIKEVYYIICSIQLVIHPIQIWTRDENSRTQ